MKTIEETLLYIDCAFAGLAIATKLGIQTVDQEKAGVAVLKTLRSYILEEPLDDALNRAKTEIVKRAVAGQTIPKSSLN